MVTIHIYSTEDERINVEDECSFCFVCGEDLIAVSKLPDITIDDEDKTEKIFKAAKLLYYDVALLRGFTFIDLCSECGQTLNDYIKEVE